MRLLLAITMYNEIEHAAMQLDNAIKMGIYDDIVVLDDGSDDGTWDILNIYKQKFNNIHIFHTNKNSLLFNGENRWKTISEIIRNNGYSPDWVNNRAADILYPVKHAGKIRERIESQPPTVGYIGAPFIHLWRSLGWYRSDWFWGGCADHNSIVVFWRFSPNFKWDPNDSLAGVHTGKSTPSDLGFAKCDGSGLLSPIDKPPLFGLIHYGMTTHKKMEEKFRRSMYMSVATNKIGKNMGMPTPQYMPEVADWQLYNGYRTFHEFTIELSRANQDWFEEDISSMPKPKIESFYDVIREFSADRAEEYRRLFDATFGNQ